MSSDNKSGKDPIELRDLYNPSMHGRIDDAYSTVQAVGMDVIEAFKGKGCVNAGRNDLSSFFPPKLSRCFPPKLSAQVVLS